MIFFLISSALIVSFGFAALSRTVVLGTRQRQPLSLQQPLLRFVSVTRATLTFFLYIIPILMLFAVFYSYLYSGLELLNLESSERFFGLSLAFIVVLVGGRDELVRQFEQSWRATVDQRFRTSIDVLELLKERERKRYHLDIAAEGMAFDEISTACQSMLAMLQELRSTLIERRMSMHETTYHYSALREAEKEMLEVWEAIIGIQTEIAKISQGGSGSEFVRQSLSIEAYRCAERLNSTTEAYREIEALGGNFTCPNPNDRGAKADLDFQNPVTAITIAILFSLSLSAVIGASYFFTEWFVWGYEANEPLSWFIANSMSFAVLWQTLPLLLIIIFHSAEDRDGTNVFGAARRGIVFRSLVCFAISAIGYSAVNVLATAITIEVPELAISNQHLNFISHWVILSALSSALIYIIYSYSFTRLAIGQSRLALRLSLFATSQSGWFVYLTAFASLYFNQYADNPGYRAAALNWVHRAGMEALLLSMGTALVLWIGLRKTIHGKISKASCTK